MRSLSEINVWILRILIIICFIVCMALYLHELRQRYNILKDKTQKLNIYQKWINFWSLLTMTLCVIRLIILFIDTMSYFCEFVNELYEPVQHFIQISATFYAISRVHYCFKCDENKCIYYVFYMNGIIWIVFTMSWLWLSFRLKDKCILSIIHPKIRSIGSIFGFIWYQIWDLSILCTFYYKIHCLQKRAILHNWKQNLMPSENIQIYLRKIFILQMIITLIQFMTQILMWMNSIFKWYNNCIAAMIVFISIYLMIEHNNNIYCNVITIIINYKLCCCLSKFLSKTISQNTISSNTENNQNNNNNNKYIYVVNNVASTQIQMTLITIDDDTMDSYLT